MDKLQHNKELLLSKIASIEHELEAKKQRSHDCKKELFLISALEEDYLSEIEALQSSSRVAQLRNTLKQLEEQHSNRRHINSNADILRKKECVDNLQCQIQELKVSNNSVKEKCIVKKKLQEDNELVLNQIEALKCETQTLGNNLLEIQSDMNNMKVEYDEMNEYITVNTQTILETKRTLATKQQELQTKKEKVSCLQEELAATKLELESRKCKPLNSEKRGNSLFGEVEDSRVKMQQQVVQLQQHYGEMKRDLQKKLQLKAALRKQAIKRCEEVNGMEKYCSKENKTIDLYKTKTEEMEMAIDHYKKGLLQDVTLIGKNVPGYVVDFANSRIKSIWGELSICYEELNSYSKQLLETCTKLQTTNTEKLNQKLLALQLKVKIEELENRILEIQLQNDTVNSKKFMDVPVLQENDLNCANSRQSVLCFENHLRPFIKLIPSEEPSSTGYTNCLKNRISSLPSMIYEKEATPNKDLIFESELKNSLQTSKFKTNTSTPGVAFKSHFPEKQASITKWLEHAIQMAAINETNESLEMLEKDSNIEPLTINLRNSCIEVDSDSNGEQANELTSLNYSQESNVEHTQLIITSCIPSESFSVKACTQSCKAPSLEIPSFDLSKSQTTSSFMLQSQQELPCEITLLQESSILQERIGVINFDDDFDTLLTKDNHTTFEHTPNHTDDKLHQLHNLLEQSVSNVSVETILSSSTEKVDELQSTCSLNCLSSENGLLSLSNCDTNNEVDSDIVQETKLLNNDLQSLSNDVYVRKSVGSPIETVRSNSFNAIRDELLQDSDLELEEINVSCITINSSNSDSIELVENELGVYKMEPDESIAVNTFPHRDSFSIESKWKEARKITSLSTELHPVASCNKENSLPANFRTPSIRKELNCMQISNREPLSERNTTVKRGIIKPPSTEKRWRY